MVRYASALYVFMTLFVSSQVAFAQSNDPEPATSSAPDTILPNLAGYWKNDEGSIISIEQDGPNLWGRLVVARPNQSILKHQVVFTATILEDLVYGAHRIAETDNHRSRCGRQVWVGIGLALDSEQVELSGFRGNRVILAKSCSVKQKTPVPLTYRRLSNFRE